MEDYEFQIEAASLRCLRLVNTCLMAFVLPLSAQLFYAELAPELVLWDAIMVVFVLVGEVVQEKVQGFFLYSVLRCLPLAAVFFFRDSISHMIPRLVIAGIITLMAYSARTHQTHYGYPIFGYLAVGLVIAVIGALGAGETQIRLGYLTETASCLLSILYYNRLALHRALVSIDRDGQAPMKKVKALNAFSMAGWTALMVAIIAFLTLTGLGDLFFRGILWILQWVARQMLELLRFIVGLFTGASIPPEAKEALEEMEQGRVHPVAALIAWLVSIFLQLLEKIYRLLGFGTAIWLICLGIRELYYNFRIARLEEKDSSRVTLSREDTLFERIPWRFSADTLGFSPAARIRRAYIGLVRSSPDLDRWEDSDTPLEIGDKLFTDMDPETCRQIRSLYERARYQPQCCHTEDARRMKELIKEARRS